MTGVSHCAQCSPAIMLSRAATMAGITAHKISKRITFLANDVAGTPTDCVSPTHPKPILLLLPWLGSKPQAIAKYCDIYFRTGFDVLVVESEVLVHVANDTQRYQGLTNRIRGHIYDSIVMGSLEHMAN
ncbi:hypothetical protein cypCar_00049755, partial [Cyprinus carpio]